MTVDHDRAWYLDHLSADLARSLVVLAQLDLDAPVPSCPGWTARDLVAHVGLIHRWAAVCASEARPPTDEEESVMVPPVSEAAEGENEALVSWLAAGADALAQVLTSLDLDGPTWHPFPVERVGRLWPRRQAHELCLHRRDLEEAAGAITPIDPVLAADGIDEYFHVMVPRLVARDGVGLPSGSLHVHCTDVEGEWLVQADADGYVVRRVHTKGDAALRGEAEALLLALWGRTPAETLEPIGDRRVAEAWLALNGL